MTAKPGLLIVDDDQEFARALERALGDDYGVRCARNAVEAQELLSPPPDVVLLDMRLDEGNPEGKEGLALLSVMKKQVPDLPVLMITRYGDIDTAVESIRLGAFDFIEKQKASLKEIKTRLVRALEQARVVRKLEGLERDLKLVEPREIVGVSHAIGEIKTAIGAAAEDGQVTVLIRGETGTGKELVARAIHASGPRRDRAFIDVCLTALPPTTIESELFGYEPGAFTDARKLHIGYIERAHGGVLFLDEIGELALSTQVKLLRVLEEREFCRLGGSKPIKVDVQILAATNANLEERLRSGVFRRDLYYRLRVHEISIPPLRERKEDVPPLVEHFLRLFSRQGKKTEGVSHEAMTALVAYSWPGNVRQVRNSLESALLKVSQKGHSRVELDDLPADILSETAEPCGRPGADAALGLGAGVPLDEALARAELSLIARALEQAGGRKTEAWKLLGLNNRFALRRRVRCLFARFPALRVEFPKLDSAYRGRGS